MAKYSWLNLLLVFIPVSWALHFSHQDATVVFCTSFVAIIPLATLLSFATEEIAMRMGHAIGGLVNATLGNSVEFLVAILALVKGELRVVQSAMIGSILSNSLLVLGMCFFAGGIRFYEQNYGVRVQQLNISLLGLSFPPPCSILSALSSGLTGSAAEAEDDSLERDILKISRGTAVILLFVYVSYLVFQFWTHDYLFSPEETTEIVKEQPPSGPQPPAHNRVFHFHTPSVSTVRSRSSSQGTAPEASGTEGDKGEAESAEGDLGTSRAQENKDKEDGMELEREEEHDAAMLEKQKTDASEEDEWEQPLLSFQSALVLILIVTVLAGFTAEWLVDSIDGLTESGNVSKEFTAIILLPLVGNTAEHLTAVTVSVKNKLDLSLSVAIGSSIQIALLVLPLLVVLGWIIGQPLSFHFDVYESCVLLISILVVNFAIADGRTNWLEGLILMVCYILIALSFWFYPSIE
ncbi:calcium/proton exchanger [Atractiella rhizophila]|nr:calcium/proton exchanger [Atractiella rhizophila]